MPKRLNYIQEWHPVQLHLYAIGKNLRRHGEILFLVALPIFLLFVNNFWLFLSTRGSGIDPYIYTGYMLDLKGTLHDFGATYYASRLPWIAFGSVIHSALDFPTANLVLRLTLFYVTAFSVYVSVRTAFEDRAAATCAALVFSTNVYFLSSISWDYIDGPGVSLLCLYIALVASAHKACQLRRQSILLFGSGCVLWTAISIQLFLVLLLPALTVWHLGLAGPCNIRRMFLRISLTLLGGTAALILYGLINRSLGGSFNYLEGQLTAAQALHGQESSDFHWIRNAGWLVYPFIMGTTSLILIARCSLRSTGIGLEKIDRWIAFSAIGCLTAIGTFVIFEMLSSSILRYIYYADYLLPFGMLVFGGAIHLSMSRLSTKSKVLFTTMTGALLIVPLRTSIFLPFDRMSLSGTLETWGVLVIFAIIMLCLGLVTRRAAPSLIAFAMIGLINPGTVVHLGHLYDFSHREEEINRSLYLIPEGAAAAHKYDFDGRLLYWYNSSEPLGGVFTGIASIRQWSSRLISDKFPSTVDVFGKPFTFKPGQRIALLSSGRDINPELSAIMASLSMKAELIGLSEIRNSVRMEVVQLAPLGRPSFVDLSQTKPAGGEVATVGDAVSITTVRLPYAYAALIELPKSFDAKLSYVRVQATVSGGSIGLGLLNNEQSAFIDRTEVRESKASQTVYLRDDDLQSGGYLIVQTWGSPIEARVVLQQVVVFLAPDGS